MTVLHLQAEHLSMVQDILKKHLPGRTVVAFGSRVSGHHKPHSDLDLCVMGDKPLSLLQLALLREDFSDSNLPIRVDLIDWSATTPEFQQRILKNNISIIPSPQ